mmetsp:Transcript_11339/g.15835  ORF Transcript_11339/g.15835 Transcript_11339/m.15835 type:complete len:400 (-) Transcript_11339:991-2190(-)
MPECKALVSDSPVILLSLDNHFGLLLIELSLLLLDGCLGLSLKHLLVLLTAFHDGFHGELFFFFFLNLFTRTSLNLINLNFASFFYILDERVGSTFTVLDRLEELELARSNGKVDVTARVKHMTGVSNKKHSSRVLVASGNQRVNGLKIQEVSRLVHNKQVRADVGKLCEDNTSFLSSGETLHTSLRHLSFHTCLLKVVLELTLLLLLRVFEAHPFKGSHFKVKLFCRVLSEVSKLKSFSNSDGSSRRLETSCKKLQESRLTSTVRSHDTHAGSSGNGAVGRLLEDLHIGSRITEGDILHVDERYFICRGFWVNSRKRGRIWEGEHISNSNLTSSVVLDPPLVHSDTTSGRSGRIRITVAANEAFAFLIFLLIIQSFALFEGLEVHLVVVDLLLLNKHD